MQAPGDRITLSDIVNFSSLTGDKMMDWEVTALVEMGERLREASEEKPPLEPLTLEALDAFFPLHGTGDG